ncbi:MAG: hypothetical protein KDA28_10390, partial [Phycisphaerales bacterium]|nr:hypothetical protein [Phycisphaerales bacterium]
MPLMLTNTLTRAMEPLTPSDVARIRFYSCGPTVYDDQHIGNFRSFLAADVLRRFLESELCEVSARDGTVHRGPRTVVHVMNITDVGHMTDDGDPDGGGEDKMIEGGRRIKEAKKSGRLPEGVDLDPANPWDIAGFFRDRFLEDARRLGLKVALEASSDPTLMPRATDSVPGMIRVIERLVERGHAYVAGNAVYFDVTTLPHYGKLSGNTLDHLREGEGGRVTNTTQQDKRHPADFLLWKHDEAHLMKWESPWGVGYPGWHIECTAMAFERLVRAEGLEIDLFEDGAPLIDIHSGGEDN